MTRSRRFLLVLLFGFPLYLFGQAFSSLNGTVTDPSGAVVPNTTITIKNIQTGVERQTTSDGAGRYTFVQVIPGSYMLNARAGSSKSISPKSNCW